MNETRTSIRCDCAGACTNLVFTKQQLYGAENDCYYFTFENSYLGNEKISKLKQIWNIIRGKRTIYAEVYVDSADKVIDFFNNCMEVIDSESKK